MATNNLRKEVLKTFKKLHRTRQVVFQDDKVTLDAARKEINSHFVKNKRVTNTESIKELLLFADQVNTELRTTVAQMREIEPGKYALNLRPELKRLDNCPPQQKCQSSA